MSGTFWSSVFKTPFVVASIAGVGSWFVARGKMQFFHKAHDAPVQELMVFEINERDKGSPVFLPFGGKKDPTSGAHVNGLGDLVPFSNKVTCFTHFYPIRALCGRLSIVPTGVHSHLRSP